MGRATTPWSGRGCTLPRPSFAETNSDAWADVERYFQAANAGSRERIRLFRLAFDAAVSSFSGRQQLYERYYSGDPVRLAATLYAMHDQAGAEAHVRRVLDAFGAGAAVVSPNA